MATHPVVTPETYSDDGPFNAWIEHFERAAALNEWSEDQRAQWLAVRLVGRAQIALRSLSEETVQSFTALREALCRRFKPESKRGLYAAEFHVRQQPSEDWASFGEDLKSLIDKAFPDMEARPGDTGGGSIPDTAHRPTAGVQHPAEAARKHRRRSHRNPRDASAPEPCQASYYRRQQWCTTSRKSDRTPSRGRELPHPVIERTNVARVTVTLRRASSSPMPCNSWSCEWRSWSQPSLIPVAKTGRTSVPGRRPAF